MGNNRHSMKFNEKFLKRNFNESLKGRTNSLDIKERDYMISAAMRRLNISSQWHDAVARGACYLSGDKFWQLVDSAQNPKIRLKANYFVKAISRELAKTDCQ